MLVCMLGCVKLTVQCTFSRWLWNSLGVSYFTALKDNAGKANKHSVRRRVMKLWNTHFLVDFCCALKSQSFELETHERTITAEKKNRQIACPRNFAITRYCGMKFKFVKNFRVCPASRWCRKPPSREKHFQKHLEEKNLSIPIVQCQKVSTS